MRCCTCFRCWVASRGCATALLQQPAGHPVELRARAFAALKQIFAQLAAERPLVLRIEDLQWSDADSGRLLGALLCEEDSPAMLVVATDRTDARLINPTIEELQAVSELAPRPIAIAELELSALLPDEALALAEALLDGHEAAPSAAQLAAESRGNPLLLAELARFVVEAPRDASSRADLRSRRCCSAESSRSRRTAGSCSSCWRPRAPAVRGCGRACGGSRGRRLRRVQGAACGADSRMRSRAVETSCSSSSTTASARSCWAPSAMPRAARSTMRLARAIEVDPRAQPELLIEQYVGARMPLEAARCARGAADQALASLAFARAAQLYEHALELAAWSADERGRAAPQPRGGARAFGANARRRVRIRARCGADQRADRRSARSSSAQPSCSCTTAPTSRASACCARATRASGCAGRRGAGLDLRGRGAAPAAACAPAVRTGRERRAAPRAREVPFRRGPRHPELRCAARDLQRTALLRRERAAARSSVARAGGRCARIDVVSPARPLRRHSRAAAARARVRGGGCALRSSRGGRSPAAARLGPRLRRPAARGARGRQPLRGLPTHAASRPAGALPRDGADRLGSDRSRPAARSARALELVRARSAAARRPDDDDLGPCASGAVRAAVRGRRSRARAGDPRGAGACSREPPALSRHRLVARCGPHRICALLRRRHQRCRPRPARTAGAFPVGLPEREASRAPDPRTRATRRRRNATPRLAAYAPAPRSQRRRARAPPLRPRRQRGLARC